MDFVRPPEVEGRHFDRNYRPEMEYDRPPEEEGRRHRNWRQHEERQFNQADTLYREYSNQFEEQNHQFRQDSFGVQDRNNGNFGRYEQNFGNEEVCIGSYDDRNPRLEMDSGRNHRPEGRNGRTRPEVDFNGGRPEE